MSISMSMSIMNAEEKYSEKFVKDLEKFVIWLGENEYVLSDLVTGDSVEWNESLIEFEEPGRNKLECYVKELLKYYSLGKNGEEIDDIKTMIKNFRDNKPKKRMLKKVAKVAAAEETVGESSGESLIDIIIKNDVDTEDACYIETLNFTTEDLTAVFGEPLKNGKQDDKHQYEWKLVVISDIGESVYSIYNWMDKTGNFKEYNNNEWHLATMRNCPKTNSYGCECQLEKIVAFINNFHMSWSNKTDICENVTNKTDICENVTNKTNICENVTNKTDICENVTNKIGENVSKKEYIKTLFNLTDEEDNIIDIDDIHF